MLGTGLRLTEAPILSRASWWLTARHRLDGIAPAAILSPASGRSMLDGKPAADAALISRQGGAKYVIGKDGALVQIAANTLAYDYSSGRRRLRFEGAATNSIRNSTMVGAGAGTPGSAPTNWSLVASASGLTRSIVGVGSMLGKPYIDVRWRGTIAGTASAQMDPESSMQLAGVQGQTWTHAADIALVAGAWPTTGNVYIGITERSSAGSVIAGGNASLRGIGSALTRISHSRTLANASTAYVQPVIRFDPSADGEVVDFTVRIAAPQMEMSAAASSYIPTSGAAVTRPADVAPLWSGAGQATAWAWRGSVPAPIAGQTLLGANGGPYLNAGVNDPTAVRLQGTGSVTGDRAGTLPGPVAACFGWDAAGRRIAINTQAAIGDAVAPTYARAIMALGAVAGLAAGQILDIDELVAWRLPDRPSAAGCQAQARAWSA
ncbi:phage head spike fiber domain-containing protein [Pleomorphomonas koreensis]|uniref:phage head spike fiber domain-containing protein n=1 Tax=Pleomorphomonas koreensis TaxID=257440 RepID=UPI0003FEAFE9|nr:hypothetical protein [Pleomorphomonas koreensis]